MKAKIVIWVPPIGKIIKMAYGFRVPLWAVRLMYKIDKARCIKKMKTALDSIMRENYRWWK